MTPSKEAQRLQDIVWGGSVPLEIRLSPSECRIYDQADPYLIQYPRVSYMPFLLPRLHSFFTPFLIDPDAASHDGWFSFEDVPLKWHYPLGLLYDLFSGASGAQPSIKDELDGGGAGTLPWRLRLHFTGWPDEQLVRLDAEGKVVHDAWINSVKEADFLRNGTAKGIMTLSKDHSTRFWEAVQHHDFATFSPISQRLLHAQGAPLRHVPFKVYLPSSPSETEASPGHLRTVQMPITPAIPGSREPQTLGTALHAMLPSLFPSRRTPILAKAVLHGAIVPMTSPIEELMKTAAYLDGWLHVGVVMIV